MRTPRKNRTKRSRFTTTLAAALPLGLAAAPTAAVPVDTLSTVVHNANATNGSPLGAFTYNPVTDQMWIASFGSTGTMRRVDNVSGAQTSSVMVTQTEWGLYLRDNNPDFGSTSLQIPNGMLINPKAIGPAPAYSLAIVADGTGVIRQAGVPRNDVTKRFYRYDLGEVTHGPGATGAEVFTTLLTKEDRAIAAGLPVNTGDSDNVGRQFAWSSDGQSIYSVDVAGSAMGGLWKTDVVTGAHTRLGDAPDFSEPSVIAMGGGIDRIIVGGAGANAGGIDYFDHDGSNTTAGVFLSAEGRRAFLEHANPTGNFASTTDGDGNLYTYDSVSRVLVRHDTMGRMSKVLTFNERDLAFTGVIGASPTPNSGVTNMQTRTIMHPDYGFEVTQILYAEKGAAFSFIAGAYVFKPGDFNRDNSVDFSDLSDVAPGESFKTALSLRGVATTPANYRFDMNGNNVVDWKDVKVLQQFLDIPDGDANMDSLVDYGDLDVVGLNYLTGGHTWLGGDFASIDPLYASSAADANVVDYVDLELLALNWDLAKPTFTDLDRRGYAGIFREDVIRAFNITAAAPAVPEPATASLLGLSALALLRRRRKA